MDDSPCFRPRRSYLVIGVIGAVCYSVMGVVSTFAAIFNIDGSFARPVLAALIFGIAWTAFTLLSAWVILAYYREKLILAPEEVTQHGVVCVTTLRNDEVTHIKWRRIPRGGSLVITDATHKVKIYLDNFTSDKREQIVQYFRQSFSQGIHEGWDIFEESERRIRDFTAQPSKSAALICAILLFAFGALFTNCWHRGMGVEWLPIGIANVCGGACCLWRIATQRRHPPSETSA